MAEMLLDKAFTMASMSQNTCQIDMLYTLLLHTMLYIKYISKTNRK